MNAAKVQVRSSWRLSQDGASDQRDVVVTLPVKTVSESNARGHWAGKARRTKALREAAGLVVVGMLRAEGMAPPCTVTLTRIAPRRLDDDNLRGALKAVRDGVADALGVDDGDPSVSWDYAQARGAAKQYAVVVCIRQNGMVR
jgi:hypothetical protein